MSKHNSLTYKEARAGLLFIMPTILIMTIFIFIPLFVAFLFSILDFNMMFQNISFVGLENYSRLIGDNRFYNALWNTILYTLGTVPIQAALSLLVAVAVQRQNIFTKFARSVFFLPAITSMTIVAIVWGFLISREIGIFSYYMRMIGIDIPSLLHDPFWAMPTIIFIGLWRNFGFNGYFCGRASRDIGLLL